MSVQTVDMLAQLFKDSQATPTERDTMLSAFAKDQNLNVMSMRAKQTMETLERRAAANLRKA